MDEELRKELLKKTAHLDSKNGGQSKNYTWTQKQVELLEIQIPIPKDTKGSEIKCECGSKTLKVVVKGETLINGDLFAPVNADEFMWYLEEATVGKVIIITVDKVFKMNWWDYLIKGDDILKLTKVNPDPSKLSDLDSSMRPEVEKMLWENSMKMQGKPFHKDPKTNEMLQKFMKEHPDMDFSKANIS